MPTPFAEKFNLVLKAMSLSRGRVAAEVGVDKSAVGRWANGVAAPSSDNLNRLTAVVAARIGGFTALDWERDLDSLAAVVGVDPPTPPQARAGGVQIPLLEEARAVARLRGGAYEGFYQSTRPYAQRPGVFIHDQVMIRADGEGLLDLRMYAAGVTVSGKVLLLNNQLFFVGAEMTSPGFCFAIFNGVSTLKAGMLDGLIMFCALDPGRTPTATAAVLERLEDLTGDAEADEARFAQLCRRPDAATEDSAPEAVRRHLVRDIGPSQIASEGDWVLRSPLLRSLARGLLPGAAG